MDSFYLKLGIDSGPEIRRAQNLCSLEERPGIGYVFMHLTFERSGLSLRRKKQFTKFS